MSSEICIVFVYPWLPQNIFSIQSSLYTLHLLMCPKSLLICKFFFLLCPSLSCPLQFIFEETGPFLLLEFTTFWILMTASLGYYRTCYSAFCISYKFIVRWRGLFRFWFSVLIKYVIAGAECFPLHHIKRYIMSFYFFQYC